MNEPDLPHWFGVVSGPLLALIPVLLWELWIKPARERRKTARVLRVEIHENLRFLVGARARYEALPGSLVGDLHATTAAFTALASGIGELPADALLKTLSFYHELERVRKVGEFLVAADRAARTAPPASAAALVDARDEEASARLSFERRVPRAIDHAEQALAALDQILATDMDEGPTPLASRTALETEATARGGDRRALQEAAPRQPTGSTTARRCVVRRWRAVAQRWVPQRRSR